MYIGRTRHLGSSNHCECQLLNIILISLPQKSWLLFLKLKTDNSYCPRIGPDYIMDGDKHNCDLFCNWQLQYSHDLWILNLLMCSPHFSKNQLQQLRPTESNRIGPIGPILILIQMRPLSKLTTFPFYFSLSLQDIRQRCYQCTRWTQMRHHSCLRDTVMSRRKTHYLTTLYLTRRNSLILRYFFLMQRN